MKAVGIDGCKAGWVAVAIDSIGKTRVGIFPDIEAVCTTHHDANCILIDIPIGLPTSQPRVCDSEARRLLAPYRHSSVFSVPCREAVYANSYREACEINERTMGKRLSKQTWNICPKIIEADQYLRCRQHPIPIVRESHPEVCFWALAGGIPLRHAKRSDAGFAERMGLIGHHSAIGPPLVKDMLSRYRKKDLARDDIVDACVLAITAASPSNAVKTLPSNPLCDDAGLPMEIVYRGDGLAAI